MWFRAILLLGIVAGFCRAQEAPAQSNEPELVQARNLVEAGKFQEAEEEARRFVASHPNSADGHRLLGYVLFKENDPKGSLAEYLASGRNAPLGGPEYEVMGCDYFLLEDYARADEWLTRAVDSGSKNGLALYLLGRAKYNEREFSEAIKEFQESLALDASSVKAQTYLGRTYEQLGEVDRALVAYRAAVALDGEATQHDAEPYAALGSLLVETNKPEEAQPLLAKAVELDPAQAGVRRELGKAYLALNQPTNARRELQAALKHDPENAPSHFLLAQADQRLGFTQEAAAEQQRYRELSGSHSSPDDPLSEARALVGTGKIVEAEQAARRYVDVHKNSADGHYLLGYILFKKLDAKGSLAEYTEAAKYRTPTARDLEVVASDYVVLHDYPDADKWYTQSLKWDPSNWQLLYYLGRTKYNENWFEQAAAIFERCLKAQPKSVKAEDNLGLALEGLGKTEEAMAAYRQAIAWESEGGQRDAGPYLDLGSILVTNDRAAEGLHYLQQALAIAAKDVRVHRELGKAYMHMNQLDSAKLELEKSVQLAPNDAPTHFVLGQVYRKLGLAEKARVEMERYTELTAAHSTQGAQ